MAEAQRRIRCGGSGGVPPTRLPQGFLLRHGFGGRDGGQDGGQALHSAGGQADLAAKKGYFWTD
jgi:hypothetical protein